MIVTRLALFALCASVVAAIVASSASAALFFLFKPTSAQTGDLVTVRLGGTPASFTLDKTERPFQKAIRIYLVPNGVADDVSSRLDPRLSFIGRIVPDRNVRGVLSFKVPPLDTGAYALAAWCPECARYSFGRTFFMQTVPKVSRYRHLMGLHVRMPSAIETCPVSGEGTYGNGLLSTTLPRKGVLVAQKERGLFQKLGWLPRKGFGGELTVRGERLDAPARMRVLAVNWGYTSTGLGSWRSAVTFPSEGCWRITGRVRDISLSYVVKVVGG